MTILGLMKTEFRIAELKARLSSVLRDVRSGAEIVVKDRETPIARIAPYETAPTRLVARAPSVSLADVDKLPFFRPKRLRAGDLDRAIRDTKRDKRFHSE